MARENSSVCSEEGYLAIFDRIAAGVLMADPESRQFGYANPAVCRMFGYSQAELLGLSVKDIHPQSSVDHVLAEFEAQTSGAHVLASALPCLRKDGSVFYADISSTPIVLRGKFWNLGFFNDVTERKLAESRIHMLQQQIEYILGATNTGLDIIDADFNVVYVNAAWSRVYGDYTGRKCYEYFMGRDMICPGCGVEKARQTKERVVGEEVLTREGNRPIQVTTIPFQDENGAWLFAEVNVDITERKLAETELRKYRESLEDLVEKRTGELERSNKELEQFAYVASHDLQEPLRVITGFLQLLARRYKGKFDADADEFIGFAVDGAKRLQLMIRDLLLYSRLNRDRNPMAMVDCTSALRQAISNLQVAIADNEALVTYDQLPVVMADYMQLVRLFQNLLQNDIKFRGELPPRIHVSAERKDLEPSASGLEAGVKSEWVISLKDNGIGIDPACLERVFLVFQRLHPIGKYSGSGIGLAVCKKIVEGHGGRIWAESQPGQGSTFHFTIPAVRCEAEAEKESAGKSMSDAVS